MNGFFGQPAVQHALLAGTAVGGLAGLVGYLMVLRGEVFAGDALGHVSYTGALAALAAGLDLRLGLFAGTIAVGAVLGVLGGRRVADDVVVGTTFSWVLGLGVLCLALFTTRGATGDATANVTVLFGSILGISGSAALTAAVVAIGLVGVLLVLARPLLFASVDPDVAAARGVPVRWLGPAFLAVVGAAVAEATQLVGALLLLGLIAAPPAVARRLTTRPYLALGLSAALTVGCVWAGLGLGYAVPVLPPSFAILAVATALYAGTAAAAAWSARGRARIPLPCG